ncbi:MAG TPA: NUDIX domain-containing protein [Methylomirabilota bacterium]|nr:NUDIX domain-containing protein [Methylomirabilota bacterium]
MAHYVVPVKPAPAIPSPAATVVLLRDRSSGDVECLLMRRHLKSKFAAGDFVFPGGKIEADDNPDDAAAWCRGLDMDAAARRLSLESAPRTALGFWIGAIRETFEEAGLLLALDASGHDVSVDDARFADYRRACHADNRAFWTMIRKEDLRLATDRLVYFAHWITPEEQPLRFDTRFFAAPAPAGQTATGDDYEMTDLKWLTPAEAVAAMQRGEISLRNPTVKNLMLFDGATSTAHALDRLRDRVVTTIRPRVIMEGDQRRVLMPGDPGYF